MRREAIHERNVPFCTVTAKMPAVITPPDQMESQLYCCGGKKL